MKLDDPALIRLGHIANAFGKVTAAAERGAPEGDHFKATNELVYTVTLYVRELWRINASQHETPTGGG